MWDTGSEHGSDTVTCELRCVKNLILKNGKNISQHNRLSRLRSHRPTGHRHRRALRALGSRTGARTRHGNILEAVLRVYAAARGPRVHAAPPTGATGTASHEPARRGPEDMLHSIIDW